jgi:hypothetical protein
MILICLVSWFTVGFFFGVRAADRSQLILTRATVATALAAESDYEPQSFAAFSDIIAGVGGLAGIDVVIADDGASQETVDAMNHLLIQALSGLTLLSTHQDAETAYATATAFLDDETFTVASRERVRSVLLTGRAILDEATSGEVAVSALKTQLLSLSEILVSQAVMNELTLKNNLAISRYYEDRNLYTVSSHDAFKAAVDAYGGYLSVQQLMIKADVTEEELVEQIALIDAAFLMLDPRGDTGALFAAYQIASQRNLEGFIPASVSAYQNELARILGILNSPDQNQAAIDTARADLLEAENLLVPHADKSELVQAIREARDVRKTRYTVTSYYQLSLLLDQAVALVDNPDALQTTVDQLVLDIADAIENLVILPDQIELTVGKPGINLGKYVTLGDSQITGYTSSDPTIATVDAAGNVTPIRFGTILVKVTLANGVEETLEVFVKEKIKPVTLILLGGIPLLASGAGIFMVMLSKGRPAEIAQRIRKNQGKPKKTLVTKDGISEIK